MTASDGDASDLFGNAVSISGDYAIVGAFDDDKDANLSYGSAYIFIRNENKWIEETKLLVDDCAYHFGSSVSISDNYAIVGAQGDNVNGSNSGSAYIFVRKGDLWERHAKIFPDDGSQNDGFGGSVSISGNYAIIGCDPSNKAYIYVRNENIWLQDSIITDGDSALSSVSIYGNYAIVGSPNNNTTGSVFIYVLNEKSWLLHKTLTPEDLSTRCFGHSVSISNNYAIIGVKYEKSLDIGTAYIYKKIKNNWEQQIKLNPIDGENNDYFGTSVAISNNYAIVGVPYDDDNTENSGSVYIYQLIDNQWMQEVKLTSNDNAKDDRYGISVSISDDYAIVGADHNDSKGNGSGVAYIYPTTTTQAPIIKGFIKDIRGKPFQGATIEFEDWKTVHTNESGFFKVEVSFRWAGNATIFYNNYIFNPQQIEYTIVTEDITDQSISISVFTISGFIKDITGNPLTGIEIVFNNNGGSTFTNSLGYYSHDVYHNWTGIAKAQGKGYKFEPIIRTYENVSQDYYNQNCHASKPSLSGFCFDINNQPIENVEIHLTTNDDKYLTDKSGFYNIDVDYHWNGKIRAVKTGYSFEPEFFEYYDFINSCGN
ncbi:MAG: PKD domain-containing protein, partial [Candidatus Magnetoglobus multicellularis str. Araruama]